MRHSTALLIVLGLAAVVGAPGCTSAEAEPLELTYYYLPG
jgi:hypothetical protein